MQKTKLPSFVTVLALTLITVVMWVSFDVYRLFSQPTKPSVPESVSAPLTPTLDLEAINQLEGHTFLNDSEIPDNVVGAFAVTEPEKTPIPEPSPLPESAPGETSIPTPENASGSGEAI